MLQNKLLVFCCPFFRTFMESTRCIRNIIVSRAGKSAANATVAKTATVALGNSMDNRFKWQKERGNSKREKSRYFLLWKQHIPWWKQYLEIPSFSNFHWYFFVTFEFLNVCNSHRLFLKLNSMIISVLLFLLFVYYGWQLQFTSWRVFFLFRPFVVTMRRQ